MNEPFLYFSGLQADTGEYAIPPSSPRDLHNLAHRPPVDEEEAENLRIWTRGGAKGMDGDPRDLSLAGWGVIFAETDARTEEIREALKPLLELRRAQVGKEQAHRFQEYTGRKGYRKDDTKRSFLNRHGIGPGKACPDRMPYYLLIVGDPETISYEFQYQLDVVRAVGRIWFETVEEYERYARSVVDAETGVTPRGRRAGFFSPRHPGDHVSDVYVDHLASPLASWIEMNRPDWTVTRALEDDATKARLARMLGGDDTPDFLFTASHGAVFHCADARVLPHQGALMCREWPGPSFRGRFPTDFYFTGEELAPEARLAGLIVFLWACYSAGAPARSDYEVREHTPVAPRPFLGALPYGLLSHPAGSALAVIGHVELVHIYSAEWPGVGRHLPEFEEMLSLLLEGYPVGAAMEPFGRRYAELATELCEELLEVQMGKEPDAETTLRLCVCHDARNYVVLGDPAVRLVPPENASPEPGR
jgi:hypothetical protein